MRLYDSSGQLASEFNPFEEDYLAEILEAVAVAWRQMPKPKRNEIENKITSRLAGWLMNAPDFVGRLPFHIIPQYEIPDLQGKILGRLDICFKYMQTTREYFAFEAKRLHVSYPGGKIEPEYRDYVGDPGMMAFIEGQYSKNLPAGGMLGYIMDGDTQKAWSGLGARIENHRGELKLTSSSKFSKSLLSQVQEKGMQGTLLGETSHQLEHQLRLFHLLLPVAVTN
jgi:hypothetical protein